ncbi:MAG: phosphoribosylglycinamide formyltransferase [Alphaproteobacteria bacterium]|nr:phosphoribosylglycinamide formyltransferase [Alphaproteobacteria bacterium]
MTLNIAIIGSTKGTSSQQIIDAVKGDEIDAKISFIISDKQDSGILERAKKYDINGVFLPVNGLSRSEYDNKLNEQLKNESIDIIILIGYMRILSDEFVKKWNKKLINIHPSLLPKFAGGINNNVHKSVLDANEKTTGCSVHYVSEVIDGGEIILQKSCDVLDTDNVETLKKKVQELESQALLEVVKNWKRK